MKTNYQFIADSDIDTMSEILTTLLVQTLEQAGYVFSMKQIAEEKRTVKAWLKAEITAGEYLN